MTKLSRIALVLGLLAAGTACAPASGSQNVTATQEAAVGLGYPNPSGAQNLTTTAGGPGYPNPGGAASFAATQIASGMPPGSQVMPAGMAYLNPMGAPVTEWNGIPIMPQATAGQEFNKTTYSFTAGAATPADVQAFYTEKFKALGWSSQFSGAAGEGAVMPFTKGSSVLTITVAISANERVVVLIMQ